MTAALIIVFLMATCFPIWPMWAKVALWYLSVTFLIALTVFLTIRFILFIGIWLFGGYEFWILPRLFDDQLTFQESFVPVYTLVKGAKGQIYYRFGLFGLLAGFCVWAYNQPTDFDEFMTLQKDFVADMYSGKLLSDTSQAAKEDIDKPKMPSVEDLMRDDEEDGAGGAYGLHDDEDIDEEARTAALLDKMFEEDAEGDEEDDELDAAAAAAAGAGAEESEGER